MAYIGKRPTDSFRSLAVKDTFTGDGSTVAFDISQECGSATDLMVFVDNVRQEPGSGKSYTLGVDGSNLLKRITFDAAPAASADIYVINPTLSPEVVQTAETSKNIETTAITSQTGLTTAVQGADTLLVYDNSATALKKITLDNLLIGGTELATQAADDDVLLIYDTSATEFKKIQKSNIATVVTFTTDKSHTGDGSDTTFTINSGRSVDDVLVFVNGICLVPTDDYTISGTTLTFATAPANTAEIVFRYLG